MTRSHELTKQNHRLFAGVDVLAAVVEAGSFGKAADILGLTQSGVSRAIARLENRVGVRMLDRTTRSVSLTSEGRHIYEEIKPLLANLEETIAQASGSAQTVRGRLRINVDALFCRVILAPRMAGFLARYPELSVDLITTPALGDLVAEGIDLAIRFMEPKDSSLISRKLLETRVLTVAAPAYLKMHGIPSHPDDLKNHSCLHFRDPQSGKPFEWEFRRGKKVINLKPPGQLYLTDPDSLFQACLSGAGIGQVLAFDATHFLTSKKLVEILSEWAGETYPLYVFYPSRKLPPAKLRAFLDFVNEALDQWKRSGARTHPAKK